MKRWQVYAKKSIISMLSDFCEVQVKDAINDSQKMKACVPLLTTENRTLLNDR